ncbi:MULTISPECIES: hypothetical protein [unclassified Burkholderia]
MPATSCSRSSRAASCAATLHTNGYAAGSSRVLASDAKDRPGWRTVLVRPDGVVAWAGDNASNVDEAAHAATRWFGQGCASSPTPS